MNYEKNVWDQLRSCSSKDFYRALKKDKNWNQTNSVGSQQIFRNKHDGRYVSIHLHPSDKGGYGPKLLKELLNQINWTEEELIRLKLIK
jgi:predicted RNA binding protein YcfA (HicA-like mRNA interferase family)